MTGSLKGDKESAYNLCLQGIYNLFIGISDRICHRGLKEGRIHSNGKVAWSCWNMGQALKVEEDPADGREYPEVGFLIPVLDECVTPTRTIYEWKEREIKTLLCRI